MPLNTLLDSSHRSPKYRPGWRNKGGQSLKQGLDLVIGSSFVQNMILHQRWKGLTGRPVPDKSYGVVTKRPFQMGEVVCCPSQSYYSLDPASLVVTSDDANVHEDSR